VTRFSRYTGAQVKAALLFVGGMAGAAYETLWQAAERPTLLVLFGAMMGLPFFLRADANRLGGPQPPAQVSPDPATAPPTADPP
jgi:glucose dehydrogenase